MRSVAVSLLIAKPSGRAEASRLPRAEKDDLRKQGLEQAIVSK
jgi:hypothetical protein